MDEQTPEAAPAPTPQKTFTVTYPSFDTSNLPYKHYVAEALATFCLTLAVSLSLQFSLAAPFFAALTVALFVYMIGPMTGAHINPAVTLGMLSIRKITTQNAVGYIISQVLGAVLALFLAQYLAGGKPDLEILATTKVGIAEALGAFILVLSITSVAYKKVSTGVSGGVIGTGLILGIVFATGSSNGVLNPAVAVGIGSLGPMYILGPVVGGVIGAWVGKYLFEG